MCDYVINPVIHNYIYRTAHSSSWPCSDQPQAACSLSFNNTIGNPIAQLPELYAIKQTGLKELELELYV